MTVLVAVFSAGAAWTMPRQFVERLRADFPHHTFVEAWNDEDVRQELAAADVAFAAGIPRGLLAGLSRLRWVQSPAAGVGGLLSPELAASDIVLTSARGVRARAIAEHVLGVTLALARQLHTAVRRQTEHRWALEEIESSASVRTLRGRRLAIVGLGAIGEQVAAVASGFGMHVSAVRRRADRPAPPGVEEVVAPEQLFDVLRRSDVIVLAAPLTPDTRRMIDRAALANVKPGAFLVNVGRGKLLDDDAVVDALRRGVLGGAALDVFTKEPLDPASPYWDLPNVIVTPHVSGAMEDYWTPLVDLFADNLRRFERGDALVNVVDKAAGY